MRWRVAEMAILDREEQSVQHVYVISAADIGFIVFVPMPGHVPMNPGALGPIFWIIALALTTVGVMQAGRENSIR